MILLDTNVFLELMLNQKRARECEALLGLVSTGEVEAAAAHFTVHAVEAALGTGKSLETFLRNIEHSVGLYVYDTNLSEEMAAALISKKISRDFDDALQYYMTKVGVDALRSKRLLQGFEIELGVLGIRTIMIEKYNGKGGNVDPRLISDAYRLLFIHKNAPSVWCS